MGQTKRRKALPYAALMQQRESAPEGRVSPQNTVLLQSIMWMWPLKRTGLFQNSGFQTILTIHPISKKFRAHTPNICMFITSKIYTCTTEVPPSPQ